MEGIIMMIRGIIVKEMDLMLTLLVPFSWHHQDLQQVCTSRHLFVDDHTTTGGAYAT